VGASDTYFLTNAVMDMEDFLRATANPISDAEVTRANDAAFTKGSARFGLLFGGASHVTSQVEDVRGIFLKIMSCASALRYVHYRNDSRW